MTEPHGVRRLPETLGLAAEPPTGPAGMSGGACDDVSMVGRATRRTHARPPRTGEPGWLDLLQVFAEACVPAPPIPRSLRATLKRQGPWCWSTVRVDPMAMYFLGPAVPASRHSDDYAAVSHAGHGLNSYGLNLYLVTGPVAVFVQHLWGGHYDDSQRSNVEVTRTYTLLHELLAALKEPAPQPARYVLQYSDFRNQAAFYQAPLTQRLPALDRDWPFEVVTFNRDDQTKHDPLDRLFAHAARVLCDLSKIQQSVKYLIEDIPANPTQSTDPASATPTRSSFAAEVVAAALRSRPRGIVKPSSPQRVPRAV